MIAGLVKLFRIAGPILPLPPPTHRILVSGERELTKMMRTTAAEALRSAETVWTPEVVRSPGERQNGTQARFPVQAPLTAPAETRSAAGQAKPRKPRRKDPRKTEIEEQARMQFRMLRAMARRAVAEDPGRGLKALLEVQKLIDDLVNETAEDVVSQVGVKIVADEIGSTKQAVSNRWGPSAAARRASQS